MEHVATLVAARAGGLSEALAVRARSALKAIGADTAKPRWLCDGLACDIGFENVGPDQAAAALLSALAGETIDVFAQAEQGRRKRLLVADMDSTIVTSETLDDLAEYAGIGEEIAEITARAMRGELDFEGALKARVAKLEGLSEDALEKAYARITVSDGAETLVRTMAADGAITALVSGGFRFFTTRIAERLGFHLEQGNELILEGGKLTGEVGEPILTRDTKYETLVRLSADNGLTLADAVTVGDGANDLAMIQAAGLGVAYRGKPLLRGAARALLDHADLTALLYAQGYRSDEFVVG